MSNEIKKMPVSLKRKIRKLNSLILTAKQLETEIEEQLREDRVPYDNLVSNTFSEPVTEALAFINNGECMNKEELDEALENIENVYLHFVNLPIDDEEKEELDDELDF